MAMFVQFPNLYDPQLGTRVDCSVNGEDVACSLTDDWLLKISGPTVPTGFSR